VSGNDAGWPAINHGDAGPQGELGGECDQCPARRPLTRATADVAAARALGLFEVYPCPSGLGWHLRVVKNFWQD
jgi:hypothetical protein